MWHNQNNAKYNAKDENPTVGVQLSDCPGTPILVYSHAVYEQENSCTEKNLTPMYGDL